MRLKVWVEVGESTLHKLQRASPSRGAGLQGNRARCIPHPGIMGASRGKKDKWGITRRDARTMTSIMAKHVDEDAQRGGVVRREDEVGLRFFLCNIFKLTSVLESMPHLSAERTWQLWVHACTRRVYKNCYWYYSTRRFAYFISFLSGL